MAFARYRCTSNAEWVRAMLRSARRFRRRIDIKAARIRPCCFGHFGGPKMTALRFCLALAQMARHSDSHPPQDRDSMRKAGKKSLVFVDAFAGCGGLSLGLMQAGLLGRFAIEHDKFAFETLRANLLGRNARHKFSWPQWLPKEPFSIAQLSQALPCPARSDERYHRPSRRRSAVPRIFECGSPQARRPAESAFRIVPSAGRRTPPEGDVN